MTAVTGGSTPWVLIVDDDEDNRELLAEFLEVAGYETLTFGTASAAGAALDQRRPPCLLITDVRMPDMEGRAFVASVRGRPGYGELPALFVTGIDARSLGPMADPVLTKPIDLDALMAVVDRHCRVNDPTAVCS